MTVNTAFQGFLIFFVLFYLAGSATHLKLAGLVLASFAVK
jgi:hypothetical protein